MVAFKSLAVLSLPLIASATVLVRRFEAFGAPRISSAPIDYPHRDEYGSRMGLQLWKRPLLQPDRACRLVYSHFSKLYLPTFYSLTTIPHLSVLSWASFLIFPFSRVSLELTVVQSRLLVLVVPLALNKSSAVTMSTP